MQTHPTPILCIMRPGIVNDDVASTGAEVAGNKQPHKPTKLRKFLVDNHLIIFLCLAFLIGLSVPEMGRWVSKPSLHVKLLGDVRCVGFANVFVIFLISGLRLKTDAMLSSLRSPLALLLGIILIIFVTPCVGFITVRLPIQKELRHGFTLFSSVPTTLASGAALISGCQGADRATELALMLTVASNLLGCFSTPVILSQILGNADISIDAVKLILKLVLCILLPTCVGKVAQVLVPGASQFAKTHKLLLTILANFSLCFYVWQAISNAQQRIVKIPFEFLALCIACALLLHCAFWLVNLLVFVIPGVTDVHHRRGVFLLASQKTLPVSLAILAGLPESSFGEAGLVALPCIFGHFSQLIADSFLVKYWNNHPCALEEITASSDEPCASSQLEPQSVVTHLQEGELEEGKS